MPVESCSATYRRGTASSSVKHCPVSRRQPEVRSDPSKGGGAGEIRSHDLCVRRAAEARFHGRARFTCVRSARCQRRQRALQATSRTGVRDPRRMRRSPTGKGCAARTAMASGRWPPLRAAGSKGSHYVHVVGVTYRGRSVLGARAIGKELRLVALHQGFRSAVGTEL